MKKRTLLDKRKFFVNNYFILSSIKIFAYDTLGKPTLGFVF